MGSAKLGTHSRRLSLEALINRIALAGFSEKIFDIMKLTEMDKNALVEAIENYPIQVVRKNKR